MKHTISSKEIVLDFWRLAIGQRDLLFAEKIISDHYIQHSASVKDGKKGILESLEVLAKLPTAPASGKPFMRVIADGELVAIHMLLEMGGRKLALLDLMRVQNGLLTEHWDAVQIIPEDVGNFMVADAMTADANGNDEENKGVISNYMNGVLFGQANNIHFIADNFVEHDPQDCLEKCSFDRLHRMIGENDLVLTQATGTINAKPHVLYDIFRVWKGKIVEHWNVHQLIPEKMPHSNKIV